ncbi:MAG TPA: phosphatidylserine/phosphatidylglycerophosphate/cardiolipin synthase family protein [Chromatiales bacterium]|nr:phosphatidylserine/phosphatidylglycerophosphate/cardiolipin synthase family protein [Chromatiales bacterium]
MRPFNHKSCFPWRSGCYFTLLVDGPRFFPRMLDAIREASDFICLEMYLMESGKVAGRFITALVAARQRGVRVFVLLDDFGSHALDQADRRRMTNAGIHLQFFNPFRWQRLYASLPRDHRKLLLVDGELAFVGGAGITDEFQHPTRPALSWRETMVQIEGPVVQDWLDLFSRSWQQASGQPCHLPVVVPAARQEDQLGRVSIAEGRGRQEINRSLIKRSRNAERRIWICTPYFIVSRKLRHTLRRMARAGLDVRVMVPGPISDHPWVRHASRGYYTRLLRQGVRIFEYQPRFLHAKIQLCDNWASIGSSNLDRWNQRWNLDANQEIDDPRFATAIAEMFEADLRHCHEIRYEDWLIRPASQRIREWFWGRCVRLLDVLVRLLQRRHTRRETDGD